MLDVRGPDVVRTGETVTFQLAIANRDATGVQEVELECEFDRGLLFPGREERRFQQPLGPLAAGATQTVPLSLEAVQPGTHCVRFSLTARGRSPVRQESCVRVEPSELEVQIVGPTERHVGDRVELVLTVLNQRSEPVREAEVTIEYPPMLTAREASAGVTRGPGQLSWNLGTLQPRERVRIQVEFEAVAAAANVELSAILHCSAGSTVQRHSLRLTPPPQPLRLSVSDSADPVTVGQELDYLLTVTNAGGAEVTQWKLTLRPGAELELGRLSARIGDQTYEPSLQPSSQGWSVTGLPPLAPDSSLSVHVAATGVHEGTTQLEAILQVDGASEARGIEPTIIEPPLSGDNALRGDGVRRR